MKAVRLRTEYMDRPMGIDIVRPRFNWNCEGGKKQSAYRIIATRNERIIWDSGKVKSSDMAHIRYNGLPLHSRDIVTWIVQLWDESDVPGKLSATSFELGLLETSDWKAKWITGNYAPKKNMRYPVDCFKKSFGINNAVVKARLYVSACGIYNVKINRKIAGDFYLAPGYTDYRKRIQYQVYDVTTLLCKGTNTLELQLADGWYRGSIGCFGVTNVYGRQTAIICQLEICYEDGDTDIVVSDESFLWSDDGPVRFADLKDGEIYDASMIPSYKNHAKQIRKEHLLTSSDNVSPRKKERFKGKLINTPNGEKVIDFGQNIAGIISFGIKSLKGTQIKLYFGEMLDENGNFTQHNIHKHYKPVKEFGTLKQMILMFGKESWLHEQLQPTPKQEITFLCSGKEDNYCTQFAIFGFRYMKIETEADIEADMFEAIAVYSDLEETGEFLCSSELVTHLFKNTKWSMKGNFLDIPTDCPTRERLGWLGDGQIFFNTANYIMNAAPFYRKWLTDIRDSQKKDGRPSAVAPYAGMDMLYGSNGSSVGWADAVVLIPYRFWKMYNDIHILEENYEMMRRYAHFMIANTGHKSRYKAKCNPFNKYTYEKGVQLGEWLEPQEFLDMDNKSGAKMVLQTEVCTAYLHYIMNIMAEVADILGKSAEIHLYNEYAVGAKRAYKWLYLNGKIPDTDRPAKLVRPLALGLIDDEPERKRKIEKRLEMAVVNREYCIGTGFLSTPFILPVLCNAGKTEMAYKMLLNEKSPGWLYEIKKGATTIWEDWEGSEFASRNHYAMGAVCQWLFEFMGGICVSGKNHFDISPVPGENIEWTNIKYNSIYGNVEVSWRKDGQKIIYHIEIPSNTTARIKLPGMEACDVCSGIYEYVRN